MPNYWVESSKDVLADITEDHAREACKALFGFWKGHVLYGIRVGVNRYRLFVIMDGVPVEVGKQVARVLGLEAQPGNIPGQVIVVVKGPGTFSKIQDIANELSLSLFENTCRITAKLL